MVTDTDWKHLKMYDNFMSVNERVIRQTSTANSPWMIIEGADANYRELTVGKAILQAMRQRLDMKETPVKQIAVTATPPKVDNLSILKSLDMNLKLDKKKYSSELSKYQGRLALLTRKKKFQDVSVVLVFEGNDAAGKGGSIRRVTGALDPRIYRVVPIAAPTQEEKVQPYLWRFWRHLPRRGRIVIFDRSWYGRVLVERIEGFASKPDWLRAYEEINDFEEQLIRNRTLIAKFWLTISPEEQLARFKAREETGYKRYKITDEDWRNREKFEEYSQAVCDMVDRTSTAIAPWTIVEANDKNFARVKVLKTVCDLVQSAEQ
jgi:polyphosphate:AMP phosphotransferase